MFALTLLKNIVKAKKNAEKFASYYFSLYLCSGL